MDKLKSINWKEILLYSYRGGPNLIGKLGDVMNRVNPPLLINNLDIKNEGRATSYPGCWFRLAAPGETPDINTPRGYVDWNGFSLAMQKYRRNQQCPPHLQIVRAIRKNEEAVFNSDLAKRRSTTCKLSQTMTELKNALREYGDIKTTAIIPVPIKDSDSKIIGIHILRVGDLK